MLPYGTHVVLTKCINGYALNTLGKVVGHHKQFTVQFTRVRILGTEDVLLLVPFEFTSNL